jgi:hypothetical protein
MRRQVLIGNSSSYGSAGVCRGAHDSHTNEIERIIPREMSRAFLCLPSAFPLPSLCLSYVSVCVLGGDPPSLAYGDAEARRISTSKEVC